jgi:hypothetical protein
MSKDAIRTAVTCCLQSDVILLPKNITLDFDDYEANVFQSDVIQNLNSSHQMHITLKAFLDGIHSSLLRKIVIDRAVPYALKQSCSTTLFIRADTLKKVPYRYLNEYQQFVVNEYQQRVLEMNEVKPLVLKRLYKKYGIPLQHIPQDVLFPGMIPLLNGLIMANRARKEAAAEEIAQIRDMSNPQQIQINKNRIQELLRSRFGWKPANNGPL